MSATWRVSAFGKIFDGLLLAGSVSSQRNPQATVRANSLAFPKAAFGEGGEPLLSANCGRTE